MQKQVFTQRTEVPVPAATAFAWHARPGAFERLTPPWEGIEPVEASGGIQNGGRRTFRLQLGPLRVTWVAEHRDYIEGKQFRDVQLEGPFEYWEHTHHFEADGSAACHVEDRIEYTLPFGPLGAVLGSSFAHAALERTFTYRHRTTVDDLAVHAHYSGTPLTVAISGASGLVGRALCAFLTTGGHRVIRLVRDADGASDTVAWDPTAGTVAAGLEGIDAVVHLAGESVAGGRWTPERKAAIRDSRMRGTRVLCAALARLAKPPPVLISASAIGYYGDRGASELLEGSRPGTGFLADVCREWEAATQLAADAGIRVVHARLGVVLSAAGGALATMVPPFQYGAGGTLGSGKQYMSWVSIDDVLGAILHCITTESVKGAVNMVGPKPVTNRDFTSTLGQVLGRPTIVPLPAFAARLAFGEMADEMLLASARVLPAQLRASGYAFRDPTVEGALRHTLGR